MTGKADADGPSLEEVRAALESAFAESLGNPPSWSRSAIRKLGTLHAWTQDGGSLEEALRGFFGDERAARRGYPLGMLAANPDRYAILGDPRGHDPVTVFDWRLAARQAAIRGERARMAACFARIRELEAPAMDEYARLKGWIE